MNCVYKVKIFCENPNIINNIWGWKLCIFHKNKCGLNKNEERGLLSYDKSSINFLNKLKEY